MDMIGESCFAFDDRDFSFGDRKSQDEGDVMTVQVRAAALSNYAKVARQLGLDPNRMLREAGLSARALNVPDLRVPAAKVLALLEASAEKSGCLTFGLRMAESRRLSDFGAISLLITHQPTLRDVLVLVIRYRDLLNEALTIHLEDSGDLVIIREELVTESSQPARQSYELAVGTIFRLFRAILGPNWYPYSVNFTHPALTEGNVHRRLFGLNVKFDTEFNGIVCNSADLDRPNPAADPVMARYARQFLDTLPKTQPSSATPDVRKAIYILLPLGKVSSEQIAQSLGFNVRTLQRRLDDEKSSLSKLVDGVRRELAVRYLSNSRYQLIEIAEMLGYAQPSSFTRWFVAQFGVSPTRWQARLRAPGSPSGRQRVRAQWDK
jgi:AraC-like DNA-binding protein